jgi:hypothetical protein
MVSKGGRATPIIVAPIRITHWRRNKLFGSGVIKGGDEDADEIAAHVVRTAEFVNSDTTLFAEVF